MSNFGWLKFDLIRFDRSPNQALYLTPVTGQPPEFPVSLVFTLVLLENRYQVACLSAKALRMQITRRGP